MDEYLTRLLNDWATLNKHLPSLTEDQLVTMIKHEIVSGKRKRFVERLHQRFCRLRDRRERDELFCDIDEGENRG